MAIDAVGVGSITDSTSNTIVNAIDHVTDIKLGTTIGADTTECITEITLNLTNNNRIQRCIGSVAPNNVGVGIADFTGSISMFLETITDITTTELYRYINFNNGMLSFRLTDLTNSYIFTINRLKLTDAQTQVRGQSQDGIAQFDFAAEINKVGTGDTDDISVTVSKF